MYFILSKVLWFFTGPVNLLVSLAVLGAVLLFTRAWRAGRALVGLAVLGLSVLAFSPLGNMLMIPLEDRFPPCREEGPLAGIVVLGGEIETGPSVGRGQLILNDSAERLVKMADLARRHPELPVVFTGGSSALVEEATGEADILDRHLGELGLPQGRVRFERSSRNTFENARFTAAMLRPKAGERYLLVTSAFHTPRAMALFRSAGFEAVACPVDYRTADSSDFWQPFVRAVDGLRRTDVAVREWAGLAVARLLGHTDSLFPGP